MLQRRAHHDACVPLPPSPPARQAETHVGTFLGGLLDVPFERLSEQSANATVVEHEDIGEETSDAAFTFASNGLCGGGGK